MKIRPGTKVRIIWASDRIPHCSDCKALVGTTDLVIAADIEPGGIRFSLKNAYCSKWSEEELEVLRPGILLCG